MFLSFWFRFFIFFVEMANFCIWFSIFAHSRSKDINGIDSKIIFFAPGRTKTKARLITPRQPSRIAANCVSLVSGDCFDVDGHAKLALVQTRRKRSQNGAPKSSAPNANFINS